MGLLDAIKNSLEHGAPDGIADSSDMAAINAHASKPLDAEQVFVFPMVSANRALSTYATRMADSSLERFVQDYADGRPVHVMHDRAFRAAAYTYGAHFDPTSGEARVSAFLVKGRTFEDNGVKFSTNQEIADIQAGLRRYVSVGVTGPFVEMVCELCNKELMSGMFSDDGCWHLPGMKYDGEYATARLEHGQALEVSLVDFGAIPGAQIGRAPTGAGKLILPPVDSFNARPSGKFQYAAEFAAKAEYVFRAGKIGRKEFSSWLDEREQADPTIFHSVTLSTMPQESADAAKRKALMSLQETKALLRASGLSFAANLPDGDSLTPAALAEGVKAAFAAEVARVRTEAIESDPMIKACYAAEIKTPEALSSVLSQAKDGAVYAAAITERAKVQAIRLYGAETGERFYNASKHLPVKDLAEVAAAWESEANKKFGVGQDRTSRPKPQPQRFAVNADGEGDGDNGATETDAVGMALRGRYKLPGVSANGGNK